MKSERVRKLLVLPGDGIGPEVMHEALRVLDWASLHAQVSFSISKALAGGPLPV
jgi:3-isopropylmalate dehydrogenase